jgi:hypothetical protein
MVEVIDFVKDMLEEADSLAFADVFYGDQELIPRVPTACLEGDQFEEDPTDVGLTTNIVFTVQVIVYHSSMDGAETTRRDTDLYAEAVKAVLNSNRQLRSDINDGTTGLVTHCWVGNITYGYAVRQKKLMRAVKLQFNAVTRGRPL